MSLIKKRILILDNSFISGPIVEYLTRNEQFHITVVSTIKQVVDHLVSENCQIISLFLDITHNQNELDKLIKEHDCIISLLSFTFQSDIASLCIKHRPHMITTSSLSPKMKALHDEYEKKIN